MASDKQDRSSVKPLTRLPGEKRFMEICLFMAFPGPSEKENFVSLPLRKKSENWVFCLFIASHCKQINSLSRIYHRRLR